MNLLQLHFLPLSRLLFLILRFFKQLTVFDLDLGPELFLLALIAFIFLSLIRLSVLS